jgi:2,4-dienoyl-CoA reductase-like NADH-dependent reductase (Old Yellow Enzyme family)/thioredoxin reductase
VTEDYAVDPRGRGFWCAGLWNDEQIAPHRELTERVHAAGARIFAQIYHCGRQTSSALIGAQPVSASALPCPVMGEVPHPLTTDEIAVIVEQFGDTARRAKEAGFDGVEIHGAHGYLIAQFLSSYSNKRTDEYGGSLPNRMRFALEIVANIRAKVGDDFAVSFRISGDEFVTGGRGILETKVVCQGLEAAGVDLLHISAGVYESAWAIIPSLYTGYGWITDLAAAVKQVVSIPVQVVGRITRPELAETLVRTGQADLVSFARGALADPDLPRKYAEGRAHEIRECIGCNQGCITVLFGNQPIRCLVNPSLGHEGEQEIKPAATKKNVLVVGGGPAGLEAARGARLAGHDVVVHERQDHLGGNLLVGAIPPAKGELTSYITWLAEELDRLGVPVTLNSTVTIDLVAQASPDVVVLASGARHLRPDIPGLDSACVVEACDVLMGRAGTGQRVVVAGGGMIGSETAAFIASNGRAVTIVDQLPDIALEENLARRRSLLHYLEEHKVQAVVNATITRVHDGAVTVTQNGVERVLPCDTVVLALGMTPDEGELAAIEQIADVRLVGDVVKPADALEASRDGFVCGLTL